MFTFTRSQMKGAAFSGFILGITLMLLAGCAPLVPEPTPKPLPTYTARPPQPTYTLQPTLEPLPTLTPAEHYFFVNDVDGRPCYESEAEYYGWPDEPSVLLELGSYLLLPDDFVIGDGYYMHHIVYNGGSLETCYLVELLFSATSTPFPTSIPVTPEPTTMLVKVKGTITKLLLRQVCFNAHGFIYNLKGLPILSDCIYPHKGPVGDRIKYLTGAKIEVHIWGDFEYEDVHGFLSNFGKATIKADGGEEYYVAAERGADGELLFVAAWQVKKIP